MQQSKMKPLDWLRQCRKLGREKPLNTKSWLAIAIVNSIDGFKFRHFKDADGVKGLLLEIGKK